MFVQVRIDSGYVIFIPLFCEKTYKNAPQIRGFTSSAFPVLYL